MYYFHLQHYLKLIR